MDDTTSRTISECLALMGQCTSAIIKVFVWGKHFSMGREAEQEDQDRKSHSKVALQLPLGWTWPMGTCKVTLMSGEDILGEALLLRTENA